MPTQDRKFRFLRCERHRTRFYSIGLKIVSDFWKARCVDSEVGASFVRPFGSTVLQMNRPFISLCQQELGKMKWVETSGKPTRAMTQPTATRQRPLSPHLSIYRPKITMTMSIIHRITGGALYFGTLLLAAWLIAAAIGEDAFNMVSWVYSSWIGYLVLFGYTGRFCTIWPAAYAISSGTWVPDLKSTRPAKLPADAGLLAACNGPCLGCCFRSALKGVLT